MPKSHSPSTKMITLTTLDLIINHIFKPTVEFSFRIHLYSTKKIVSTHCSLNCNFNCQSTLKLHIVCFKLLFGKHTAKIFKSLVKIEVIRHCYHHTINVFQSSVLCTQLGQYIRQIISFYISYVDKGE